jgi:hypothetical protein
MVGPTPEEAYEMNIMRMVAYYEKEAEHLPTVWH